MEQRSNDHQIANRRNWVGVEKTKDSNGLNREAKRKLALLRVLDKAQVEQVLHRIGKEAQESLAHDAGMKAFIPKSVKARKAGLVKGMKTEARARASHKIAIGAAREEISRDQSPARRMSQIGAVAGAKKYMVIEVRDGTGSKSSISLLSMSPRRDRFTDGEFHFVAVDESEMGQVRKGGSDEKRGDRSGREVSVMKREHGFGLLEDQGMDGGLAGGDDGVLGCPGDCSGNVEGFQTDRSDHISLSDESKGCVAHGAELMALEGRCDGGSYH